MFLSREKLQPLRVALSRVIHVYGLHKMKGISLAIAVSLLGCVALPQAVLAKPSVLLPAAVSAQNNRYEEAEALWLRIAQRNSESADAYYNLGIAQANQQKWSEAMQSYEQAIAINPEFVHAHIQLGRAQVKVEQYQAAAQSYQRALALDPQESLAEELLDELKIISRGSGIDLALGLEES